MLKAVSSFGFRVSRSLAALGMAVLLLMGAALGQSATFTAHLGDLTGTAASSRAEVRLTPQSLVNGAWVDGCGTGNIPRVNGAMVFPRGYTPLTVPSDGFINAQPVYATSEITCGTVTGSTRYKVSLLFDRQESVYGYYQIAGAFVLESATPYDSTPVSPPAANAVITNPAGSQTVAQPAGTTFQVAGDASVTGALALGSPLTTAGITNTGAISTTTFSASGASTTSGITDSGASVFKKINGVRYADQFSGADIGAKVNAALADFGASPACGMVVVPAGSYNFGTQLALGSRSDCVIRGQGMSKTTLAWNGAAAATMIDAKDAPGLTLEDMTISGNSSAGTCLQTGGGSANVFNHRYVRVNMGSCTNFAIDNRSSGTGFALNDAYFQDVYLQSSAICLETAFPLQRFQGGTISSCSTAAVKLDGNGGVTTHGTIFSGNGADVQVAGSSSIFEGHGGWFENSTNGIVTFTGAFSPDLILFAGAKLHTSNATNLMNLTSMGGGSVEITDSFVPSSSVGQIQLGTGGNLCVQSMSPALGSTVITTAGSGTTLGCRSATPVVAALGGIFGGNVIAPQYPLEGYTATGDTWGRLLSQANGVRTLFTLRGLEGGATERGITFAYFSNASNFSSLLARGAHFILGSAGNGFRWGKSTTSAVGDDAGFTTWATLDGSTFNLASGVGLAVGGGSTVNKILNGSATLTYTAIAAQTSQEKTLTITGASTTNFGVFCSPRATLGNANVSWSAWVSAADTVSVRVTNPTAASITPSAVAWGCTVNQ